MNTPILISSVWAEWAAQKVLDYAKTVESFGGKQIVCGGEPVEMVRTDNGTFVSEGAVNVLKSETESLGFVVDDIIARER